MPLMQMPTQVVTDPRQYLTVIYGDSGVGKTSFCAQIPGHYFFMTEIGTKGLSVYGSVIKSWDADGDPDSFVSLCLDLAKGKAANWEGQRPVDTVVIDSYDELWNLAADYVMKNESFTHNGRTGKYSRVGDVPFGKGTARVNEFLIGKLKKLILMGFGVVCIARMKERVQKYMGQDFDRYDLRLSESIKGAIVSEADAIGHFVVEEAYHKDDKGEVQRVEKGRWGYWQASFLRLAKHRLEGFPERVALPLNKGWETYEKTFRECAQALVARNEAANGQ